MAFQPKRYKTMADIKICSRCDDKGYLMGTKFSKMRQESWTEVCPYCMPTNKYGNLQEKLKLPESSQLEYKPDKPHEDEWGTDGGQNLR